MTGWGLSGVFIEALKQSREYIQVVDSREARFAQQMIFARSIAQYCLADEAYQATLLQDLKQKVGLHAMNESGLAKFLDEVIIQWREWGSLIEVKTDIRCTSPPIRHSLADRPQNFASR